MEQTIERIIAQRDETGRSALIPLLQGIQEEVGYIPPPAISSLAKALRIPEVEVYGVVTFYAQFRLEPQGRNVVKVCQGTACHVRGSDRILRRLEDHLGIRAGQTSPDLEFSLETVACIGACALAPTMVINGKVYGQMSTRKVEEMFTDYSGGKDD